MTSKVGCIVLVLCGILKKALLLLESAITKKNVIGISNGKTNKIEEAAFK